MKLVIEMIETLTEVMLLAATKKRMMLGAVIGLIAISPFILMKVESQPEWGNYWRLRPLILTPLFVSIGAMCTSYLQHLGNRFNWNKWIVNMICIIGFLFSIWIGIILGLDGTLWN